jgi:hypothetical protein
MKVSRAALAVALVALARALAADPPPLDPQDW